MINIGAIIASQTAIRAATNLMMSESKRRREREEEEREKEEEKATLAKEENECDS